MGRITALEARAAGAPWIFAPVADVNSEPDNPIINIRSFGEDPQHVAALAAAYVRGVEENGALATGKHFPGHGDTDIDSHLDLPTVDSDPERISTLIELVPFRAAMAAGVSTVMTGHIAVPALETDAAIPATLSEKISSGLLRPRPRLQRSCSHRFAGDGRSYGAPLAGGSRGAGDSRRGGCAAYSAFA